MAKTQGLKIVGIVLALLAVSAYLVTCFLIPAPLPQATSPESTAEIPSSPPPKSPPRESVLIFSFNGSTEKTSKTFYITREPWYIEWNCKIEDNDWPMYFGAQLCSETPLAWGTNLIDLIASVTAPKTAKTYIHNYIGGFYIDVDVINARWEIRVYQ